ncbi:hypothetical protein [Streptomyces sp. NPDC055085]
MQRPVAELLRLGGGQFTVQQQDAGLGQQVDRCGAESSQRVLTPKWREGKRPKLVVLPERMWSSTVACPRWRTSRNWAELPPGGRGVGEEYLVTQALVLLEQS